MDDYNRLDDKMKIANLQIEKRLSVLEEEIMELKDSVRNVTEEIVYIKNSISKTEKVKPIASDVSDLAKQFKDLRASFNDVRSKFSNMPPNEKANIDTLTKRIEKLEKKLAIGVPTVLE